jgi:hypothetical protein
MNGLAGFHKQERACAEISGRTFALMEHPEEQRCTYSFIRIFL